MYIGTFFPSSMCLILNPSLIKASSKEKEHPMRKETKSFYHRSATFVLSYFKIPFIYILYLGKSVEISHPFGHIIEHFLKPV